MGPYHGPLSFFLVARITCNYSFFLNRAGEHMVYRHGGIWNSTPQISSPANLHYYSCTPRGTGLPNMYKSKLERQNLTLWILWNFNDNPSLQQSDLHSDCLETCQ